MTYERQGADALDYLPCRYGTSKLMFRGPRRKITDDYVAFLGTTETYGKYVSRPYSDLVEEKLGTTCVNFGVMNASVDAFLHDPEILALAGQAKVTVVQCFGAHNMSNRFYRVHPRRNDRLVEPSALLRAIYRDVDFTEFHFTRHMLNHLLMISPERFDTLREEVQTAWSARMKLLLKSIPGDVVLLALRSQQDGPLGREPLFVTQEMVEALRGDMQGLIDIPVQPAGNMLEDMVFPEMEAHVASSLLAPDSHRAIALTVAQQLLPMLKKQARQ